MSYLPRLYEILEATTQEYRKGPVVERRTLSETVLLETTGGEALGVGERPVVEVVHLYAMPHQDEARDVELVDVHFLTIGVHDAEAHRAELVELLRGYPQPERLAGGPSYIEVGAMIGDQGAALRLFALGKVLGLWDLVTPARFGYEGATADELAGRGFVMITGYKP